MRREPEPSSEHAAPAASEAAALDEHPVAPPQPEQSAEQPTPPDPRHSDVVHQPTTEFHVEEESHEADELFADPVDEDASPVDEDVLEETPEFLQETPEHDRLWFEQRPPRDFDFDD